MRRESTPRLWRPVQSDLDVSLGKSRTTTTDSLDSKANTSLLLERNMLSKKGRQGQSGPAPVNVTGSGARASGVDRSIMIGQTRRSDRSAGPDRASDRARDDRSRCWMEREAKPPRLLASEARIGELTGTEPCRRRRPNKNFASPVALRRTIGTPASW